MSLSLLILSSEPELSCSQRAVLVSRHQLSFQEMPEAIQTANILHTHTSIQSLPKDSAVTYNGQTTLVQSCSVH